MKLNPDLINGQTEGISIIEHFISNLSVTFQDSVGHYRPFSRKGWGSWSILLTNIKAPIRAYVYCEYSSANLYVDSNKSLHFSISTAPCLLAYMPQ